MEEELLKDLGPEGKSGGAGFQDRVNSVSLINGRAQIWCLPVPHWLIWKRGQQRSNSAH